MTISILSAGKIEDVSTELLMDNGKIKLLPYEYYNKLCWNDFRFFCHNFARYGIPTIELVEYINKIIDGRTAIEIGSGAGDLGFHLNIPMTDSKIQESTQIKKIYEAMQQPVIKYPADVEKIDALDAVKKHKPKVVVASWITTYAPSETTYISTPNGVKEMNILDLIDTFILVGNLDTHGDKPIRTLPHETIKEPFNISRAARQENNRIFIWNR